MASLARRLERNALHQKRPHTLRMKVGQREQPATITCPACLMEAPTARMPVYEVREPGVQPGRLIDKGVICVNPRCMKPIPSGDEPL